MKDHELDALLEALAAQDQQSPLPPSFQNGWREAVKEEKMQTQKNKKPLWRGLASVAAALVFLVGGTLMTRDQLSPQAMNTGAQPKIMSRSAAPAGEAGDDVMLMMDSAAPEEAMAYGMGTNSAYQEADFSDKKIIQTLEVSLRTQDFEGDMEKLKSLCTSLGGWVEYAWQSGDHAQGELRRGDLTLRIPTDRLEEARTGLESIGRLVSLSQSARDVTASYQDTQARLNTQLTKMERLQTLLAKAEEMDDLIRLESAIADTQYTIDSYQSQLKNTDRQVDYTSITVNIREEAPAQTAQEGTVPLGKRIEAGLAASLEAMGDFFQAMAVFLMAALPWLGLGLLLLLALKVWLHRRRK